jgi:uncharacterized membrane protein
MADRSDTGSDVGRAAAVGALTIVAALLRIPLLTRPMGNDEAATFLYYASHPISVIVTIYGSPNNHILHSILMHASYRMFGGAEWALRLPALLAGIAIVPLTYFASRSLIAAALAASAPVLIDYSTDARGYTLLCCFVLICVIAIQRNAWRTFAISAALGFYTVPVMLYPFLVLIIRGGRKAIRPAVEAIVIAAVLYAPALMISGIGAIASNPYVRPLPLGQFFSDFLPYINTVRGHLLMGIPIVVQILLLAGFFWSAAPRRRFWIALAVVLVTIAMQRVLPFPRVWLPFLIMGFITAAAAWRWPKSEPIVAAAIAITLAITGYTTDRLRETGELRAVREIARQLNQRARPGDPVLALQPSEMPLAFYCHQVEVLNPDLTRPHLFAVENRDYGQSLPRTLAFFKIDPRKYAIRKVRDFGSSALWELRR